jgi:hypothetical protein
MEDLSAIGANHNTRVLPLLAHENRRGEAESARRHVDFQAKIKKL